MRTASTLIMEEEKFCELKRWVAQASFTAHGIGVILDTWATPGKGTERVLYADMGFRSEIRGNEIVGVGEVPMLRTRIAECEKALGKIKEILGNPATRKKKSIKAKITRKPRQLKDGEIPAAKV